MNTAAVCDRREHADCGTESCGDCVMNMRPSVVLSNAADALHLRGQLNALRALPSLTQILRGLSKSVLITIVQLLDRLLVPLSDSLQLSLLIP